MLKTQFSKALAYLFDIKPARAKVRRGRRLSAEPLEQRKLLAGLTFSTAIDYSSSSAGSNVRSVAIADINGDDHADFVTTNWNFSGSTQIGGNVSVRLGDGLGSFGTATNFAVGKAPYSVAIADVNGDGKPDLAVANRGSNNISVLLGTGSGSFGPATNFATGNAPNSVATADVNGDGKPDVVAANVYGGNVSVLLNTTATNSTTPTFGSAAYFTTGSGPFSVAVADLNSDGNADVVTANLFSGNVSVLLGSGTGSFGAPNNLPSGSSPDTVAIADLNGDGKPDLAVASGGSNDVNVLLGDGTGNFGSATNFDTGATGRVDSVAIADFDSDGKHDLVTVSQAIGNNSLGVSVLLGDGMGSFGAATNLTAGTRPIGVAIADFNGDGKPDFVTANLINSVSVLLNTTTLPTITTVTAANVNYDGQQHGATVVADPGSAIGTTTFLYTGTGATVYSSSDAPINAGTYHVVVSFTPTNPLAYDPSTGSADYSIGRASISYTIGDAGHVYGSTTDLATALGTTLPTGVNGESLGITYSSSGNTSTADAGSYGITGHIADGSGFASNYIVTLTPGMLTVSQAILTGNATTQDALNMAKQGNLTITISNVLGLMNGDSLNTFLNTAEFYITVGLNKYAFIPTSVTTSGSSLTVAYSLKNSDLATSLAAELADNTSAATAVSAGFAMESLNYTFFDEYLTRLFSTR